MAQARGRGEAVTNRPAAGGVGRPRTGESARSLLNTVLGEFVYPAGGSAWTQTFIEAFARLDVDEKAARQALARTLNDGWLLRERHGRRMRWRLSPAGLQRCVDGTARINSFGGVRTDWDGQWLLLFVSVPEEQRALGHRLRRRLTWAGFGSLGQGAWITPHVGLEVEAARIISEFDPAPHSVSFVSRFGKIGLEQETVADAWDLDDLGERYRAFIEAFRATRARAEADAFVALTRLVHEWRRFAFYDPVLPVELLPPRWVGAAAKALFDERSAEWLPAAAEWFRTREAAND